MSAATVIGSVTAMSSGGSPYRRQPKDLESGGSGIGFQDHGSVCDLFEIVSTKSAAVDRLKRWRQALLVLNSSRRFQNTLDLKTKVEKKEIRAKLRTHAQVIRAAYVFQARGEKPDGKPLQTRTPEAHPSPIPTENYNFKSEQFPSLTTDHNFSVLQNFGVVKGTAEMLKINPDKGINDDELNKSVRKNMFDSNIRPRKKVRWNKAPFHNDSNTLTSRGAENARLAHPKDWMFGDDFGKWVAFIGTYCTVTTVLIAFIPLKFSGTPPAYETHGWFFIASIVAHAMTFFTSWLKFYTANDLQNAMYNMILNSVVWFSAIMSHLSLVLAIIIPDEISWVGYAVLCPAFVIIFVLIFLALVKFFWESARPDKMEDNC